MEQTAIKIENVSKEYRLGAIGGGTLRGDLQSFWAKLRHKEDPNSKIGDNSGLSKGDRFLALDGVSFEVKKGEALGIIGHNGAGKSTLLKLLCRVTAPSDGKISYDGRIASMLEVGTGFHPELTGRENVYMNGAILGMTKAEIDKKFDEIVEFAEMEKFIDTPVKRYSSGMYVKLAFSVAAHLDSEIMIMDEVLAVGDMAFQKKCLDRMREAASKEGRTVLYVSHNMNTIRRLCDRCIVLNRGKVVFDGDVEDAINVYLNTADPDENLLTDLTSFERPLISTHKAFMSSVEILERDECVITRGEKLKFKLKWKSLADAEGVKLRTIVRYKDDSVVGLAQTGILGDFKKGEDVETVFGFDTTMLAEGKYFFTFAFFQSDDVGNSIILDHVTRACTVEVLNSTSDENILIWDHPWWGSIRFPNLETEKTDD